MVKPLDSTSVLKHKRDTNARMISIEFGKTVRCSPVLKHKGDTNARKISIEFNKTVRCTSVLKHKRDARVESENVLREFEIGDHVLW